MGDLVVYTGYNNRVNRSCPAAIVVDVKSPDSKYHNRIRVMWVGEEIPIQAKALSINGSKITTWVRPKYFILADTCDIIGDTFKLKQELVGVKKDN